MKQKRLFIVLLIALTTSSLIFASLALASPAASEAATKAEKAWLQEDDEAAVEVAKALEAEQSPATLPQSIQVNGGGGGGPLFVGLDDATVPAFRVDVDTNTFAQAFVGVEVWGAAYDADNDRVLFSDSADLYEWPVGGAVNFLATVSDTMGSNVVMEGLAYYSGTLYASRVASTGEGEGIYDVDLVTFQATRVISYPDPSQTTISGLDADPDTGLLYGTNDTTALRGLVRIDPDGTVTVIAPYMAGETDVDGLAVGGGKAYLITDDQTPNYFEVYDLNAMAYTTPVSTPFTTTEVFAGGAWIPPVESLICDGPGVSFESGIPATWAVVDNTGGTGIIWDLVSSASCGFGNLTNGSGDAACADSDAAGSGAPPFDTELVSNSFDLTGYTGATLNVAAYYRDLNTGSNDLFEVDVWNGAVWTNELTWDEDHEPEDISLDLAAYLGLPDVQVRFRYSGNGFDWFAQVDDVSLTCQVPGTPEITLNKTVGTDPGVCATTNSIMVPPGADVYYCYEVTNTGSLSLTVHDLDDSELGSILSGFPFTLTPSASVFVTVSANIAQTTVNTATWTAYNAGPSDVVTDTASATVTVIPPSISLNKTVGTDPAVCASTDTTSVVANTTVYYCYEVTNTGLTTLGLHDLDDSELGSILSGFSFSLAPGASAFVTETAVINVTTVNTATWIAYNAGPTDVVSATDTAEVNIVTSSAYPVCVDFETGVLPSFMFAETTSNGAANGRVAVTTAFPHTGVFAMDLDTDCDNCGGATRQAGTMLVDLAGQSGVVLDFWVFEHFDENNPEDGVFVSDNGGATWALIQTLNGFPASYQRVVLDLDAAVAGVGMSYVDGFMIRFQSLDGATIAGNDGYSFDDICVQPLQPDIDVVPSSLTSVQYPNELVTDTLTINNTGTTTLTWSINEAPTDCNTPSDVTWVSAAPTAGSTAAQGSDTLDVVFDSTGLTPATYTGNLCVNSDDPDTPQITVPVTLTVEPDPPLIEVAPGNLSSTQGQNTQVQQTLTISNTGAGNLDWVITETVGLVSLPQYEASNSKPQAAAAPEVVDSPEQCEAYENYAGLEPVGYAQHCLGTPQQVAVNPNSSFDPTDIGFAHDSRNTDNFVSFTLNDFPGQTAIGTNAGIFWGMDFDPSATILYAIEDDGNSPNTPDTLGTIDLATGAYTAISTITNPNGSIFTGLTIDHTDGTFYISDATQLFTVNPGTGAVTLVGSFGTGGTMIDIDISPTGQMYGHDLGTDSIYTIDKGTGVATLVGPTGQAANFAQGMSFDNKDGTLYVFLYIGGGSNIYGTVNLTTGAVTPLATDNPLGEFEGATMTAVPISCDNGDIPWASVNPGSGTTSSGNSTDVTVTFDSTGLAAGIYNGTLCIGSNDPINPLVTVPLSLTVDVGADIVFTKTVGLDPAVCASSDTLNLPYGGDDVTYCYEVTNTGVFTLTEHDLVDTELGAILSGYMYDLVPGDSVFVTVTATITQTTVNTATWTASDGVNSAAQSDSASVIVAPPDPMIAVTPGELTSVQAPDSVVNQTLTINNVGTGDLDWDIFEDGTPGFSGSWSDNFDSYATGSQMHGQGGWKGWDNSPGAGALTSDVQALSAPNSVDILGPTDLVYEYSGYTSGQWTYTAWQYIPTGYTGQGYFILLNTYSDGGPYNWSLQLCFDSSTGMVYDDVPASCGGGSPSLNIIYDQWVEIRVEIDLDADTMSVYYGNQLLVTDTWTGHVSGGGAVNIGAVDLFANGSTSIYYDNISLTSPSTSCDGPDDMAWVTVNPTSGTVPTSSSAGVDVAFDSTGLGTGVYTGTLCVNSNDSTNPLVTIPLTMTVVTGTYDVVIAPDSALSGDPGSTVTYTLWVTNNANVADTISLGVSGNGWPTTLSDSSVALASGASTMVYAWVDIPSGATGNTVDVATVTATSTGEPGESDSVDLTTTANAAYGVELSADMAMSGASGTTVVYSVWITNTGNTTDTFDLAASGNSWTANHAATATLGAGESMMVDVMVDIPAGANNGDMDTVTVTATSQGDTGESDSVDLTTTATGPAGFTLYLPFVARTD